jgi:ligand-binding SRPBCC domain-containing protein
MQIHLQTRVSQNYLAIFEAFDETLFRKLAPPFPRLRLLRFDGSYPGDVVEIELLTGLKRLRWTSLITERQITDREAWFTDLGQELPPPLKYWKHRHLVSNKGQNQSTIHDIIDYRTGSSLLDRLLFPFLWAQFAFRKPIYRRVFRKNS